MYGAIRMLIKLILILVVAVRVQDVHTLLVCEAIKDSMLTAMGAMGGRVAHQIPVIAMIVMTSLVGRLAALLLLMPYAIAILALVPRRRGLLPLYI